MTTMPSNLSDAATLPPVEDRFREVVRAFIIWSQGMFAARPAGRFRWRANPDETEILIQGDEAIDTDQSNQLPRIVIAHTGGRYAGVSVGQIQQYPFGTAGNTIFTDLVSTSVLITVTAQTAAEASEIGFALFCFFPLFRLQIHLLGRLHQIGNSIEIRPPQKGNGPHQGASGSTWKDVVLVVPTTFQITLDMDNGQLKSYINQVEYTMQTILGDTAA